MKSSTKAALISGLVFPGLGHLYLRKYVVGFALIFVSSLSIYFMISTAVDAALTVAREIETGNVPLNADAIGNLVAQKSGSAEQSTNVAMIALVACWVAGIFDSFRIARTQEQTQEKGREKKT